MLRNQGGEVLVAGHPGNSWWQAAPAAAIRDPYAFVMSLNIHRRHLSSEQRREVVAALLKQQPSRSNRAIGTQVKVSDKTVAAERRRMEARAEIPHAPLRFDSRGRWQPADRAHARVPITVSGPLLRAGPVVALATTTFEPDLARARAAYVAAVSRLDREEQLAEIRQLLEQLGIAITEVN